MLSATNKKTLAGGAAALALIIAGTVWFEQSRDVSAPQTATGADDAVDAGVNDAASPDVSTEVAAMGAMAPAIDTFFRNPDETTVIAGRATPGQVIAIMMGGAELDRVTTGDDGNFGAVVFIPAADQPRRVRLIGDPDGQALASAESVIVPPSAPRAVAEADAPQDAPEIGVADGSQSPQPAVDGTTGPVVVTADVAEGTAPDVGANSPLALSSTPGGDTPEVATPPTLIADADGVRVIARPDPAGTKPEFLDNIALDTITYDTKGEVVLAGRAVTDGFVQVYLDNKPVTTSRITEDGDWSIDLPDIGTGVYTLRVDEVDGDGNVQSRIETPFKREEADAVAALLAEETSAEGFDVAVRTVQPGATLWAIAEEQFGDGIMYVAVFEANRDQIRHPDLIYPGQVFRLPEVTE